MDINAMAKAAALGIIPRRTITKVKTFSANHLWSLEYKLNAWLEEQGPSFRLMDIKPITAENDGETYTVLIIYTDLEPLEDDEEG